MSCCHVSQISNLQRLGRGLQGQALPEGSGGLNVGRRGYGFWGTLGKLGTKIFKKGGEKLLQAGKKGGEKLLQAGKRKALQLAGTSKKRALDLGKQALDVGKKKAKLVGKQALDLGKQKVKEFGQKAVKEFENKLNKNPAAVVQEIFETPAKRKRAVLKRPVLKRPAPVLSTHAPELVVNRPVAGRKSGKTVSRRSTGRRARLSGRTRSRRHIFM